MTGRLSRVLVAGSALFVLCASAPAHAESLERIFSAGNEAFFSGDFARAAKSYQRLIDAGVQDPDVYFNAGVAHARNDELGLAALDFERALWLRPGDDGAEQELKAVYAALGRRRAEKAGEATLRTRPPLFEALVRPLSAGLLGGIVLALDVLFFGLLLWRRFVQAEGLKLWLTIAAPIAALFLFAAGAGLAVKTEWLRSGRAALLVRDQAEVREGPDPHAQVRAYAYEGQGARVLQRDGEFVYVTLDGGQRGWVERDDLGIIRPD